MSDITIGNLVVQMSANVARLSSDMREAKNAVTEATSQISDAAESAMHALEALGVGLSIAEFAEFVRHTREAAEHLLNLQKATGIAVEALSGLSLLAKQNGTDIDSLARAVEKLSVNMGKTPEDFRALGVSAKDPLEAFKQLADVFNLIPDIQTRNAVAMKALGKSWAEVAPVMSLGSEEIGKTVEKGLALSHMNTELAKSSKEFNDKWVELTGTGGFANQMLAALLPTMNGVVDDFLALRDSAGGTGTAFEKFGASVASVVSTTKDVVVWLTNHKEAVEAVAGAYGSWKIATWLGPLITGYAQAAVATYEKVTADMALKAATLASAEANVAATASTAALTATRVAELRAAVLATEGEVALEIATNGLIPAQARATAAELAHVTALEALVVAQEGASVTAAAAGGAVTLLGGPVGVIITLLGLAATAWFAFGDSGKTALDKLVPSADDAQERLDKINLTLKYGTGERAQIEAQLAAISAKKVELYQQEDYFVKGQIEELDKTRATLLLQRDALDAIDAKQKAAAGSAGTLTQAQKDAAQAAADFLAKGTQAADDQVAKYNALVDRVNAYAAQISLAVDQNKAVTEGEKLNLAVKDMLGKSIVGVDAGMKALLKSAAAYILLKESERKAEEDATKALKDRATVLAAVDKVTQEVSKSTEAFALKQKESVDALKTGIAEIDMSPQERAVTQAMAVIDKALEQEIEKVSELMGSKGWGGTEEFDRVIGALQQSAEKQKAIVTDLINFKIAKERDWVTGTNQAFMDYVNNATNAAVQAKSFWNVALTGMEDLLTKFFTTGKLGFSDFIKVIEAQLAKMVAQQIVVSIVGEVTGGAVAGAAAGAAGSAGGAAAGGFMSSAAGSMLAANAGTIGAMQGGVGSAFADYLATNGFISSAGSYMAAEVVPVLGEVVLAISALNALFGSHGTPTSSTGNNTTNFDTSGNIQNATSQFGGTSATADAMVQMMETTYTTFMTSIGATAAAATFGYGGNTGKDGKVPNFDITGAAGSSLYRAGETAIGSDNTAVQLAASRAVLAAIEGSDLPSYLSKVFDGLTPSTATLAQINAAESFATTLATVKAGLTETRTAAQQYADAIATQTKALGTSASTFKTDFTAALNAGLTPDQLTKWQTLGKTLADAAANAAAFTASIRGIGNTIDTLTGGTSHGAAYAATDAATTDAALYTALGVHVSDLVTMTDEQIAVMGRAKDGNLTLMQSALDAANANKQYTDAQAQALADEAKAKAAAEAITAKATSDYNVAMATATGDTAGLAVLNKALQDSAHIAAGWTQAQVDALDAAQSARDLAAANRSAADAIAQTSASIASSLDSLNGNNQASLALANLNVTTAMQAVTTAMPWIQSAAQLATITPEDASHYSAANQAIIAPALAAIAALAHAQATANQPTSSGYSPSPGAAPLTADQTAYNTLVQQLGAANDSLLTHTQLLAQQRAGLSVANQAIFDQIQLVTKQKTAMTALQAAYDAEHTALTNTITGMGNFAKSLTAFRNGMLLGNLSPLTPEEKYAEAKTQYEATLAAAKGTGPDAAKAQADLQNSATAFLQASQVVNASSQRYQEDFAHVRDSTGLMVDWAQQQVNLAQASLTALDQQVSGLVTVNASVLSVADAIKALAAAMNANGQNGGAMTTTGNTAAITSLYQSLLHRAPDATGLANSVAWMSHGGTINDLATNIMQSPEYLMRQRIKEALGANAEVMAYNPNFLTAPTDAQLGAIDWYTRIALSQGFQAAVEQIGKDAHAYATAHPMASHATGLDYVPYDNYQAKLHQGEMVLTQGQATDFRQFGTAGMGSLVAEIKALREEVRTLRAEQKEQTGAVIASNYDANDRAAVKVAAGATVAAKTAAWAQKTKAVLK